LHQCYDQEASTAILAQAFVAEVGLECSLNSFTELEVPGFDPLVDLHWFKASLVSVAVSLVESEGLRVLSAGLALLVLVVVIVLELIVVGLFGSASDSVGSYLGLVY